MQWGAWAGVGMAVTHNLLPRIIKSGKRLALALELISVSKVVFGDI